MFDATHLQNVQPTATVNVAEKSNFQARIIGKSNLKRFNVQAREHSWRIGDSLNLDFGTWKFPDESRIPRGAYCSRELQ